MKSTLMNKPKRWRWPEGFYDGTTLMPWYQIMRRLISLPFLAVALVALCVIVWLGWGRNEARGIMKALLNDGA